MHSKFDNINHSIDNTEFWKPPYQLQEWPQSILEWIDQHNEDLFLMFNEKGKIIYHTTSVQRTFGYSASEIHRSYWYEKMAAEDITYVNNHLITDGDTKHFNVQLMDNNGEWRWFEVRVTRYVHFKTVYYIALLTEITYQKETEKLMVTSEKMSVTGQLAASVAHEIRNPLTSLKGFVQLMQGGIKEKEAYYQIMLDEIEKMESITSELLFLSKPLSNEYAIESVAEMINEVKQLLNPQSKMKHIELNWTSEDNEVIYGNRSQIKQVLINLIKNAMEAMEQKGTICIDTYHSQKWLIIDVIDEGPGIPEDILHKITDLFFTTKKEGTGLGLVITQDILTSHGGSLTALSNEKQGSTFRIKLPKPPAY